MQDIKKRNIFLKIDFYIYIFFIIYFILGISIYNDYGISFDENINRTNGFVSLNYVINFFNLNFDLNPFYKNIPQINEYIDREYGIVFDLPAAAIEVILGIKNTKDIYLLRHLMTFVIFFLSTICFYFLCLNIFKDKLISLIGLIILIFSPRVFAESFYNSKDIIFLSFFILSIHSNVKFLIFKSNTNIFFAALFSALMTDVRVIGIFLIFITFFFLFFHSDKLNIKEKLLIFFKYLFIYTVTLFIFWPFLWENSFSNLLDALSEFKNYPWNGDVLYFGEFIKAKFVPWHYFFVWFFITTPLIFFIIIFCGFLFSGKILINNLINVEKNKNANLWNNQYEMIIIYIFSIFFIPLFAIIFFDSTLYTGWRQLYFLYPPLIILGLHFLILLKKSFYNFFKIILILLVLQLSFTSFFLIKNHPHQYVYFNGLSNLFVKKNFAYDYWGVSNHSTIKYLLDKNTFQFPLKISSASFTDLNKTKLILGEEYQKKFEFIEDNHNDADFIFTNYYYFKQPKFNKKRYDIPKNFRSYYKLKINDKTINELYINNLKHN